MDNEYNEDDNRLANNATSPPAANPVKRLKRIHLGRWQKPLSTLHSYKDALVPDLLSIWDIDVEEEKNIRLGNLCNIKPDPNAKVDNWLKTNLQINPPMLTIPSHEISRYNVDNDNSNIFDTTMNLSQTQNTTTLDFENAIHSTQIVENGGNNTTLDTSALEIQINNETTTTVVEKIKSKKKNKKYVKGF